MPITAASTGAGTRLAVAASAVGLALASQPGAVLKQAAAGRSGWLIMMVAEAGAASAAPGGELQDWGHLYSLHATELQQHHYLQAAAAGNGQSPGGGSGQTVAPLEVSPAATAAPLLQLAIAQLG